MKPELSPASFHGLRVGALESRMAPEMERLIARHGGIPVVAPSMQELPLSDHPQALAFGETLLSGNIDMVVFLTGVGCRTLFDILETRFPPEAIKEALKNTVLVVRGPKPCGSREIYRPVPTNSGPGTEYMERYSPCPGCFLSGRAQEKAGGCAGIWNQQSRIVRRSPTTGCSGNTSPSLSMDVAQ